ncbi:Uncharacterized protein DAT39_020724 [Clarias magur]|uniref:Uncharacterized protein n=1 Tax=Clarias magur TaxID=1594786 RepID=A0A8J4U531_CLAMG|nr:Uncharacterized protein DAT39_020724 [Clarias magur]
MLLRPEWYRAWTLLYNWSCKVNLLNKPLKRNQGFTPRKAEATGIDSSLFSCLHMCTGKALRHKPRPRDVDRNEPCCVWREDLLSSLFRDSSVFRSRRKRPGSLDRLLLKPVISLLHSGSTLAEFKAPSEGGH